MRKLFIVLLPLLILAKLLNSQIPLNVPKNGLVAWYPFNGNVNDESGNGLNGKNLGAILTEDRKGKKNSAYQFLNEKHIEIPNSSEKNIYPLTISLWYRADTLYEKMFWSLFSKYELAAWNGFSLNLGDFRNVSNDGTIFNNGFGVEAWYLRNFNDRIIGYYGESPFLQENISAQKWYHYVLTVGNNGGKIYIDGKLIKSDTWTGQFGNTSSNFLWKIGRNYQDEFKKDVSIKIDDVGIWNRELTDDEIKKLFEDVPGQPCENYPTVKDVDGNTYNTVQIGKQCWTKENLKVTKYSDGSSIPLDNSGGKAGNGSDQTWSDLKTGARTIYENDNNNLATYGYLYNWYAASDSRNVCPSGWHVPTQNEWLKMTDLLGGLEISGGKTKSIGTSNWKSPNTGATNESGFTAFPGGYRALEGGVFTKIGESGFFWTSSEYDKDKGQSRNMDFNTNNVSYGVNYKNYGFSVRCLKDEETVYPLKGLGGYWPFNGNANDESGNNNHGTVKGATLVNDRCNKPGSAYYFRGFGNNDHIKVLNSKSLKLDSTVSLLLWYRAIPGNAMDGNGNLSKDAGRYSLIAKEGDGIGTPGGIYADLNIKGTNNHVGFSNINGCCDGRERDKIDNTNNAVPQGNDWVFVAIVSRKLDYDLYINGVKKATNKLVPGNDFSIVNDLNLYFGIYGFGGDKDPFWYPFNGELDDIAYYTRELTSQEIKDAYDKSKCVNLVVKTKIIDNISSTGAKSGGTISSSDAIIVNSRGVCWNTASTPTIQDFKTEDGIGLGSFESTLSNLKPNTFYYVRAYVNTPNGTFYGEEYQFKTKSLNPNAVVFITPNINVSCDSFVEIPLLVYNFKGVLGFQGSINWDAGKLKFENISSFGPSSLGLSINEFGLSEVLRGKLSFIWNSNNNSVASLNDSTSFFILKFKIVDPKLGIATIIMTDDPIDIELFNGNFDKIVYEIGTFNINQSCIKVSGNIQNPKGLNIPGVNLSLANISNTKSVSTDLNGNYYFSNISISNYTLTPSKLTELKPRSGISTLDIGLIQAHILGNKPFQSPYQIIAADVNGSSTVSTADILMLRRFILGAEPNFNGKLYTFVDKKHTFNNPLLPFPFPQTININSTQKLITGDFIGIKLGDVNSDNVPQNIVYKTSKDKKFELTYEIVEPENYGSNEFIYRIKSAKQQSLLGMQFTINWDNKFGKIARIGDNPNQIYFSDFSQTKDNIGLIWNSNNNVSKQFEENEVIFELRFNLPNRLNKVKLELSDNLVEREAFDENFNMKDLTLKPDVNSISLDNVLDNLLVFPNPTLGSFNVLFNSDKLELGNLQLTDILGRLIFNQEINIEKGSNDIFVKIPETISSGLYYLNIRTKENFQSTKILIETQK